MCVLLLVAYEDSNGAIDHGAIDHEELRKCFNKLQNFIYKGNQWSL
jgi:hypothetical protein